MENEEKKEMTSREFLSREIKVIKNNIKNHQEAINNLRFALKKLIDIKKQVKN